MGAGQSSQGAGVSVFADLAVGPCGRIIAGTPLTGNAYLRWDPKSAEAEGPAGKRYRLSVVLEGQEVTRTTEHRTYTGSDGKQHTQVIHHRDSNSFLSQMIPLGQFDSAIKGGDYQYPFEFQLPGVLPPTLVGEGGGANYEVKYSMAVVMEKEGGEKGFFSWMRNKDPEYRLPFTVSNAPPAGLAHACVLNIPPTTEPVVCCGCCCQRGSMTLAAHIPSNYHQAGSEVKMGFEVANNSTAKVSEVTMKVIQRVRVWAHGHRNRSLRVVAETRLPADQVPGLEVQVRGKAHSKKEKRDIREGKLVHSKSRRQQFLSCVLPQDAIETYSGRLIYVEYYVELTCKTALLLSNPTVSADFVCYNGGHSSPALQAAPTAPVASGSAPMAPVAPVAPAAPVPPPQLAASAVMYPVVRHSVSGRHEERLVLQHLGLDLPPGAASTMAGESRGEASASAVAGPASAGPTAPAMPASEIELQPPPPASAPPPPASAPPAAPELVPSTVEGLCGALRHSFDVLGETRQWVKGGGGAERLSPADLARIMGAVEMKIMQAMVMQEVMQCPGAQGITCEHVAAALAACQDSGRGDVARAMARNCTDKANAPEAVQPLLSTFQWTLVSGEFNP